MAKNERFVGHTRQVSGFASGIAGGRLVLFNGWPGVVVKDIVGTTEDFVILGGKTVPTLKGDGLGDMQVEGIHQLVDEAGTLVDGDAVDQGAVVGGSASGVVVAAGAPNVGHVSGDAFVEDGVRYVDVKLLGRPAH